jgi:hypothetical protein
MAALLLAWRMDLFGVGKPATPPDPLRSIQASAITSATLYDSGDPQPASAEHLRSVAAAIASMKAAPRIDGHAVNWAGARQVRARTADGLVLSLQVVPADAGALARVTADAQPGNPESAARAKAIRGLRHNAYKLNNAAAVALLGH